MIEITDKSKCSGCTACVNICPQKCISMEYDNEGFLYPNVEKQKCIECHMCENICPLKNKENDKYSFNFAEEYACQNNDKNIRYLSTSGGAFSLIASEILKQNGSVYAAGFDSMMHVIHKRARCMAELEQMRGSKYVQSELGIVFASILEELKNEEYPILFVGTTCQAEGLYRYIPEKYKDKLYIADLLCYGVPSPWLYDRWLEHIKEKYKSDIKSIRFRDKKYGYSGANIRIDLESGKVLEDLWDVKTYPKTMFSHIGLRPICYDCPYHNNAKLYDFTLGDLWNVSNVSKEMDDDIGTTRLFVYTEKGKKLIDEMSEKAKILLINKYDKEGFLHLLETESKRKIMPLKRSDFFKDAHVLPYEQLIDMYIPISKKEKIALKLKPIINRIPGSKVFFRALKKAKLKKGV